MAIKLPGPKKPPRGTLLDNSGSVDERWYSPRSPDSGPAWNKWLNVPELALWEAVALSCGAEPPGFFPEGLDDEFDLRMAVALAHLGPAGALKHVVTDPRPHLTRVRLADMSMLAEICVPPWVLPPQFPPPSKAAPAKPQPQDVAALPTVPPDLVVPDPERRLAQLRKLGGDAKFNRSKGGWSFTGVKALVTSEKAAGRKRSDEKTIRADLRIAAQDERDSKAAGHFQGLGQR